MTTSITFEAATIAEAVKNAARIAPSKSGHAFDQASGIILDIYPGEEVEAVIRATNLDVFYCEVISCISAEGDVARWRLPSPLIAQVLGTLPVSSGRSVRMVQDGNKIMVTSGRMKATMVLADPDYYPHWEMFDGSSLTLVSGLGARIEQVEWAASSDKVPPFCGVHLDGEYAIATDRYRMARVPCKLDLPKPITIPSGILGSIIKKMGDTYVGIDNNMLLLAPDSYTQIKTVIYETNYPSISGIASLPAVEKVEINREDLLEKLNRANSFAGSDRMPVVRMFFGKGEIAVMMENNEIGLLGDVVECHGQIDHPRVEIKFTPKNIIDVLARSPSSKVVLSYDPGNPMMPVKVDNGAGYEGWAVPRKERTPSME